MGLSLIFFLNGNTLGNISHFGCDNLNFLQVRTCPRSIVSTTSSLLKKQSEADCSIPSLKSESKSSRLGSWKFHSFPNKLA